MSNYPDGFDWKYFDRLMAVPEDVLPNEAADVYAHEAVFRECVLGVSSVLGKHKLTNVSRREFGGLFEALMDMLHDSAKRSVEALREEGFDLSPCGDDPEKYMDDCHAVMRAMGAKENRPTVNPATLIATQQLSTNATEAGQ